MQEEVENRTVALAINTSKLTAGILKSAILKYLEHKRIKGGIAQKSLMESRALKTLLSKIKV